MVSNINQQKQTIEKDITDCSTILSMPDLCKEIVSFITKLKRSREHEKSFLDHPLPDVPDLKTSQVREEISALLNRILSRQNPATPTDLANAFTKGIDYLADPAIIKKSQFSLGEFDNIFNRAATMQERFNSEFWNKLNENIQRLNEEKYKKNALPGQTTQFSQAELKDLDDYFMKYQAILDKHNGTRGGMPYDMLTPGGVSLFH